MKTKKPDNTQCHMVLLHHHILRQQAEWCDTFDFKPRMVRFVVVDWSCTMEQKQAHT
jgi:nitrate reductase assembly molybdenum cofactor insertion protein NarJ